MDFFKRNQALGWVIVFLVVMNLFTIGTVLFNPFRPERPDIRRFDRETTDNRKGTRVRDFLANELDLSQEQIKKIRPLFKPHFEMMNRNKREIDDLKRNLMSASLSADPDTNLINDYSTKIAEGWKSIALLNKKHFEEMAEFLDPEQLVKLRLMLERVLPNEGRPKPFQRPPDQRGGKRPNRNRPIN